MSRDRILDAARHVCETHGVASLTMRRIAAQAGLTAPAIYRHFSGKEAVLEALADRANERFAGYLARVAGSGSLDALRRLLDRVLDFAIEDPTSYDILFFSRDRTAAHLDPEARRSPNFRTLLRQVEACQAARRLRSDHDAITLAVTLWALVHGMIALHVQGRFGRSAGRLRVRARTALELLLTGLATRQP
ncbi:MAG: TetR/AcrR family transcriptional regulator [Gemmatimonadales bacterium]